MPAPGTQKSHPQVEPPAGSVKYIYFSYNHAASVEIMLWQFSAYINLVLMDLKGRSDPAATAALNAGPVEVPQACITLDTGELSFQCTLLNCHTMENRTSWLLF